MKLLTTGVRLILLPATMFALVFSSQAESGDRRIMIAELKQTDAHVIRVVDQNGRTSVSGVPSGTGQIFDVAVGVDGFTFTPPTANISVGDTVRWTWFSNGHSVTSGDPCTADEQFCSPDDTNCDQGTLSNNGAVYEHTFDQAGTFNYFCFAHCALWRGQRRSRANSNADGHSHSDSSTFRNAYCKPDSNTDSNSFRNTIGHTTAAHSHANGDSHGFANARWKASSNAEATPDAASAPISRNIRLKSFMRLTERAAVEAAVSAATA